MFFAVGFLSDLDRRSWRVCIEVVWGRGGEGGDLGGMPCTPSATASVITVLPS